MDLKVSDTSNVQVLQVGVEEPTAHKGHTQQRLHDVADGAVVRQPDPLGRAHEVASAAGGKGRGPRGAERAACRSAGWAQAGGGCASGCP